MQVCSICFETDINLEKSLCKGSLEFSGRTSQEWYVCFIVVFKSMLFSFVVIFLINYHLLCTSYGIHTYLHPIRNSVFYLETMSSVYNASVRPDFDYCGEVWDTLSVGLSSRLKKLQNRAARIIMNLRYNSPGIEALNAIGWVSLEIR